MRAELVRSLFLFIALVILASLQDVSFAFGGVKPPFLMAFVVTIAGAKAFTYRQSAVAAIVAGLLLDGLSGFPAGLSSLFFMAVLHFTKFCEAYFNEVPRPVCVPLACVAGSFVYEIWLYIWNAIGIDGSLHIRLLSVFVTALAAGLLVEALLPWFVVHLGLREEAGA